jgi:uncharacterized protein
MAIPTASVKSHPSLTTEVFAIPLASHYLVYAPLRKLAFLATPELVNLLSRLRTEQELNLHENHANLLQFFEDVQLLGLEGDTPIQTYGSASFHPTHVTLFLTNRCNLRCTYCYAAAGTIPAQDMPLSLAKAGIDFVVANAQRQKRAGIHLAVHGGGEPTLNWKVLTEALDYARKQVDGAGLGMQASMASNGVWSPQQRAWLLQNLNALSLSWDGLEAVQNAQRPTVSGGGSHAAVWRTIDALEDANFQYGIRMTVTASSVERLAESIAYLLARAQPQRIQAEPVYDLGRGKEGDQHVEPDAFVGAFLEARRIAADRGIEMYFSGARLETFTNRFCRSCGEGFSLTPAGDVSACFEVTDRQGPMSEPFIIGTYDPGEQGFILDQTKIEALRERTVETIPWCEGCFARWHCAGDCQNKAQHALQDGVFHGHARCEITRALLLEQILENIGRQGGLIWKAGMHGLTVPKNLLTGEEYGRE